MTPPTAAASPAYVVLHCPDAHISYNGRTPDEAGVGGGITARVRLAAALARRGHRVEVICNSPTTEEVDGVRYTRLQDARARSCDVLVGTSSGGAMTLDPVAEAGHRARLVLAWVQGYVPVSGLDQLSPRAVVACSNVIRSIVERDWGVQAPRTAVVHNGVQRALLESDGRARDPYRLVFTSHPSKGLTSAIEVLRLLRQEDARFTLEVYGGDALWGQDAQQRAAEPGVTYHGLTAQRELADAYRSAGFSMHLQGFEEPFGISLAEARAAGCVPVASAVGAFPELVTHGLTGLLVEGPHDSSDTQRWAADLVLSAVSQPHWLRHIQQSTRFGVLDWDTLAQTWEGLWRHYLEGGATVPRAHCDTCGDPQLGLPDGYHCIGCGRLRTSLAPRAAAP